MNSKDKLDDRHIRALRALAERGTHSGLPGEELIGTALTERSITVQQHAPTSHRRILATLAVAALLGIVGVIVVWPSETPTDVDIATEQTAPPSSTPAQPSTLPIPPPSTTAAPTTSTLAEPVPNQIGPVGNSCLDATASYFDQTASNGVNGLFDVITEVFGVGAEELSELEFTEVVLPAGPADRGYVFLMLDDAHILCRTNGSGFEYLDVGHQPERQVANNEVLITGSSSATGDFTDLRVVGRASQSVTSIEIIIGDGTETAGVVNDGWFVAEAIGLPNNAQLDDEISYGRTTLRWQHPNGESSAQIFELFGQDDPGNRPFPPALLDNIAILQRPVTDADGTLAQIIHESIPLPGLSIADYDAARKSVDQDGVTLWVTPTTPPGGLCLVIRHPESSSPSGRCTYAPDNIPRIYTISAWDSPDTAYIAGIVLSDEISEVIGAATIDDTFLFTYNPQTYDGELDDNGLPVLSLLLTNGDTVSES